MLQLMRLLPQPRLKRSGKVQGKKLHAGTVLFLHRHQFQLQCAGHELGV